MKKIVISIITLIAIGVTAAFHANLGLRGGSLSDLALANIEALASSESGGGDDCGKFYKNHNFSGSDTGFINANGDDSCSSPCPNVSTNGVYGSTYKCRK